MRGGTVFILWFFLSIPTAGLLAETLGYPAVWGNHGNVLTDFVFPFPDLAGLLHLPSLMLFGYLLMHQPSWDRLRRRRFRMLATAAFAISLTALFVLARPDLAAVPVVWTALALFAMSDAAVALALSMLIPGLELADRHHDRLHPPTWPYVAGAGALFIVAFALFHDGLVPLVG